ncbi:uncharacterized protein PHALS_15260 [Plasmopara halstedii]|uniref:Uncharacterized protein n=1 Tax=Plasmopara halstedii TaxID=4781 RepID=A0A0N7L8K5_PLAHL|nr:uncharacterized protein PHALS_15260 [Plasmopara halstedii]CEG50131.1 hypothetical protein PHALS_15260 [Plasmopara halstedii]|eukprot:XP_024586500.1 hypothetical protein PHALS_15260 [Plasmopara halstedii]
MGTALLCRQQKNSQSQAFPSSPQETSPCVSTIATMITYTSRYHNEANLSYNVHRCILSNSIFRRLCQHGLIVSKHMLFTRKNRTLFSF